MSAAATPVGAGALVRLQTLLRDCGGLMATLLRADPAEALDGQPDSPARIAAAGPRAAHEVQPRLGETGAAIAVEGVAGWRETVVHKREVWHARAVARPRRRASINGNARD